MRRSAGRAGRILIVDDDRQIVEGIAKVLANHPAGYEVEVSSNPLEAMDRVRRFEPDLLLLDAVMPGCHGADLCRQVAAACGDRFPKVIIMSGYPLEQLPEDEMAPADICLSKPVEIDTLIDSIDRLLDANVSGADQGPVGG